MMIRVRDNTGILWLINVMQCTFREIETEGQLYIYTPRETIRALVTMERVAEALSRGRPFYDLSQ